ncbi:hypothetical protein DIPPA_58671 [Diplonema papillatum]|nr:hypothetical protein DIPPA_58671 [Diplonema papillatum]
MSSADTKRKKSKKTKEIPEPDIQPPDDVVSPQSATSAGNVSLPASGKKKKKRSKVAHDEASAPTGSPTHGNEEARLDDCPEDNAKEEKEHESDLMIAPAGTDVSRQEQLVQEQTAAELLCEDTREMQKSRPGAPTGSPCRVTQPKDEQSDIETEHTEKDSTHQPAENLSTDLSGAPCAPTSPARLEPDEEGVKGSKKRRAKKSQNTPDGCSPSNGEEGTTRPLSAASTGKKKKKKTKGETVDGPCPEDCLQAENGLTGEVNNEGHGNGLHTETSLLRDEADKPKTPEAREECLDAPFVNEHRSLDAEVVRHVPETTTAENEETAVAPTDPAESGLQNVPEATAAEEGQSEDARDPSATNEGGMQVAPEATTAEEDQSGDAPDPTAATDSGVQITPEATTAEATSAEKSQTGQVGEVPDSTAANEIPEAIAAEEDQSGNALDPSAAGESGIENVPETTANGKHTENILATDAAEEAGVRDVPEVMTTEGDFVNDPGATVDEEGQDATGATESPQTPGRAWHTENTGAAEDIAKEDSATNADLRLHNGDDLQSSPTKSRQRKSRESSTSPRSTRKRRSRADASNSASPSSATSQQGAPTTPRTCNLVADGEPVHQHAEDNRLPITNGALEPTGTKAFSKPICATAGLEGDEHVSMDTPRANHEAQMLCGAAELEQKLQAALATTDSATKENRDLRETCEMLSARIKTLESQTQAWEDQVKNVQQMVANHENDSKELRVALSQKTNEAANLASRLDALEEAERARLKALAHNTANLKETLKTSVMERRQISPTVLEALLEDLQFKERLQLRPDASDLRATRKCEQAVAMSPAHDMVEGDMKALETNLREVKKLAGNLIELQHPDELWVQAGAARRRGDRITESSILSIYLRQAIVNGDVRKEVNAYQQLAMLFTHIKDYEQAEEWYDRLYRAASSIRDEDLKLRAAMGLGEIQRLRGSHSKAKFYLHKAYSMTAQRADSIYTSPPKTALPLPSLNSVPL